MLKATKVRIYPTAEQEQKLAQDFGNVRFVWNEALGLKQQAFADKLPLSCYDIKKLLPVWKNGEYDFLKLTHSQVLQESIRHLDVAYKNAFRRLKNKQVATSKRSKNKNVYGFAVFKSKNDARQAIAYPQGVRIEGNKLHLPKIGLIKAKFHREIIGKIKTVTVSRESTGRYYASILTENLEVKKDPIQSFDKNKIIGVDLGVKDLLVTSNGDKLPNPKYLKKQVKKLCHIQKDLSRKIETAKQRCLLDGKPLKEQSKYFGANIAKNRKQLARQHEKVRFARENYQHQVSRLLANESQVVVAETLKIKNMLQNRKLSKAISDCGWFGFLTKLDYKLQENGGRLEQVSTWFPSTKTCNECGCINEHILLKHRVWTCNECNAVHDRDINAAKNIKDGGILQLKAAGLSVYAHGGDVSPCSKSEAIADEVGSLAL
jgi:putative transposase